MQSKWRNKDTQASVYLIECLDNEKLHFLKDIELGKRTTCELKNAFSKDASIFDSDLMSDKSISHYYKKLYAKHTKEDENYPIKIEGKKNTIFLCYQLTECMLVRKMVMIIFSIKLLRPQEIDLESMINRPLMW